MTNWKEKVHDWERKGRAAAGKLIERSLSAKEHKEALTSLLDEVEQACVATRYFAERDDEVSADGLQSQIKERLRHHEDAFERHHVSVTALYYLLEPLRNCLGRELVRLGELARDADESTK